MAIRVAASMTSKMRATLRCLGIPHYVFDYSAEFEDEVMRPFVEEYEAGHTPNPCIECNRRMKFSRLLQRAEELGCDFIATGHYARIERAGQNASSAASVDDGSDSWARDYAPASDDVRSSCGAALMLRRTKATCSPS